MRWIDVREELLTACLCLSVLLPRHVLPLYDPVAVATLERTCFNNLNDRSTPDAPTTKAKKEMEIDHETMTMAACRLLQVPSLLD